MDRDRVEHALTSIAQVDGAVLAAAELNAARFPENLRGWIVDHELSKPLRAVLEDEPEFETPYFIHSLNGSTRFDASDAADRLVEMTRKGRSPAEAFDWLQKILNAHQAPGLSIAALWGVRCGDEVDLAKGVKLVPIQSLPESDQKSMLLSLSRQLTPPSGVIFSPMLEPPVCALVCKSTVDPFIARLSDLEEGLELSKSFGISRLLDDVRLALTVAGPSTALIALTWFQFDDPDFQRASTLAGSYSLPALEVVPHRFRDHGPFDSGAARAVVEAFLGLDPPLKKRVRVALDRLNQALRRRDPGDRAIDTCIALETLLSESGSRTEISYSVALRAALVAEPTSDRRRRARAVVRKTYSLRSTMVHSGTIPAEISVDGSRVPTGEVTEEALALTAGIIERIILEGKIPDWDILELHGQVG